ncbi:MAG: hypothetical protein ABR970_22025, partial [Roseiarcus sp.]
MSELSAPTGSGSPAHCRRRSLVLLARRDRGIVVGRDRGQFPIGLVGRDLMPFVALRHAHLLALDLAHEVGIRLRRNDVFFQLRLDAQGALHRQSRKLRNAGGVALVERRIARFRRG